MACLNQLTDGDDKEASCKLKEYFKVFSIQSVWKQKLNILKI